VKVEENLDSSQQMSGLNLEPFSVQVNLNLISFTSFVIDLALEKKHMHRNKFYYYY
jgi:hypothetical protein